VVAAASPSPSDALFRCVLAALPGVWLGYDYGFRIAYRLTLAGDEVHWRVPLASGSIPISRVTSMRDGWPRVDALAIRVATGRTLFVKFGPGLSDFTGRVASRVTKADYTVSARHIRSEAFGKSGYTERA
jgi:hypothetical protein